MTGDRISIPALRLAATRLGGAEDDIFCARHTLALVEAVEAAHEVLAEYGIDGPPSAYNRLGPALDRFDFGDQP